MFEFVLIVAAFIILLNKIHKVEDRLNALEKKQTLQTVITNPVAVQVQTPIAEPEKVVPHRLQ